jgi:putative MATE family efflux protein
MNDRTSELGNDSIARLLVRYSTPAVIAMFVNSTYNLVDTIFVGHGAGTLALAALAVSWPIQMLIVALGMGVGIGTASIVSRSLGAGDRARANRVAGTSFTVIAVISACVTAAAFVLLHPLLATFGATDAIMPYAVDYMSVIFIGNFFVACSITANSLARAEGAARIAMSSMIIGAVTNTALDPIFIFGLNMGIRGAAVATVIANLTSFAFICWYFATGRSMLHITRRDLRPDFRDLPEVFKIGSATFFSMITGSLMAIPINSLIVHYGTDQHLAIVGIANRCMMFFFLPIFGLTQGLQPIIGFNYGAKKIARVKEAVRKASFYASIMSTGAFLTLMLATRPVFRVFTTDAALIDEGAPILRIIIICMPFIGFQMVAGSFFQAIGRARPAFVLTLSRQVIALLPLIFILTHFYGLTGLWASFPIADFVAVSVSTVWVVTAMRGLPQDSVASGVALAEAPADA